MKMSLVFKLGSRTSSDRQTLSGRSVGGANKVCSVSNDKRVGLPSI